MKPEKIKLINQSIFLAATLLLCVGIFFPNTLIDKYSAIRLPLACEPIVRLGNVPMGKNTIHNIPIYNLRLKTIVMENITTSCGCTVAKSPAKTITPFRRSFISVSINPNRIGKGGETISIETSQGLQQILVQYDAV